MNKKTIAAIKAKYPKLFYALTQSYWAIRFMQELDRPHYWYCLLTNKPYFGTIALAGQTWESRKTAMKKLATNEIQRNYDKPFNILEIGSWAGNSAVLWADALKEGQANGSVFCLDGWEPYVADIEKDSINVAPIIMNEALKKGQVLKIFLHNIKSSGHTNRVRILKGFSQNILPYLKPNSFNLIFIDGDHSYSGIKKDLESITELLIDGGVVCGDDLDLQWDEVDQEFTKENKERNMMMEPYNKKEYHPGVCLATYEFFGGRVSATNGFWMMRKTGTTWETIDLDSSLTTATTL